MQNDGAKIQARMAVRSNLCYTKTASFESYDFFNFHNSITTKNKLRILLFFLAYSLMLP